MRQGARVLECMMITRSGSGKVGFPGGFLQPGESILNGSRRKFAEETLAYDLVSLVHRSYLIEFTNTDLDNRFR